MNVLKVEKCAVNAGSGFRTVIWCAGCDHQCKGCQNPESWDASQGNHFNFNFMEKVVKYVKENDFIQGISLSGGDPLSLCNRGHIETFLHNFKYVCPDKDVWCWTGYKWDEVKDLPLMRYIDVLIDGPFILKERDITLKWRGSKNQRVIDVQKSLEKNEVILYEL